MDTTKIKLGLQKGISVASTIPRSVAAGTIKSVGAVSSGITSVKQSIQHIREKPTVQVMLNTPYTFTNALTSYVLEQAAVLENIPTFYKLLFLTCFYLFFYKIFYDIGIFFGLNTIELVLYMAWFGILILFLAFLKPNRSKLY